MFAEKVNDSVRMDCEFIYCKEQSEMNKKNAKPNINSTFAAVCVNIFGLDKEGYKVEWK